MPSNNPLRAIAVQADRFILALLWLLVLFAAGLASWYDTWPLVGLVALPAALLPTLLYWRAPGAVSVRYANAVAVMVLAALHIHQGAGLTELHFGIFVYLPLLVVYRDWRPIVLAAATIAVHHLSFHYLQEAQYGVMCFTTPGLLIVLVHAVFVVVESAALVYVAAVLRRAALQAQELERLVTALDAGEQQIDLSGAGEAAARSMLGKSLQAMIATLRNTVGSVRSGTDTIAHATREIAEGNAALSRRTERQARGVEQTARAMGALTEAVKASAEHVHSANALAMEMSGMAHRGGQAVREVVATMGEINASARQIVDIISVIDGIAFQTNILALNAAVEAARAGEQGRGFAVVASEVRGLAQRSAGAAKEIKELIGNTVQTVQRGDALVERAGETMLQVVGSVQNVTGIMARMREASAEQSKDLDEINQAIVAFDETTQENAQLVNEDAAASEALQHQVAQLAQLVSAFRLEPAAAPRPAYG